MCIFSDERDPWDGAATVLIKTVIKGGQGIVKERSTRDRVMAWDRGHGKPALNAEIGSVGDEVRSSGGGCMLRASIDHEQSMRQAKGVFGVVGRRRATQ